MSSVDVEFGEVQKRPFVVNDVELNFKSSVETPSSHRAVIFTKEGCAQSASDQTILWFTFPEEILSLQTDELIINSGPRYYSVYVDPEEEKNFMEIVFYHCNPDCFRSCDHHSAQSCVNAEPVIAVIVEFEEGSNMFSVDVDPADIYIPRLYSMSLELNHLLLSANGVGIIEEQ